MCYNFTGFVYISGYSYSFSRLYGYILVYATLCSFFLGVVPGVDWIVSINVNYFISKNWHCFYSGYGKVDVTF